jgi:phosphopantothenoylcysteine decarboxylase/phosphopantothenate--cysteine ligase
MDLDMYQHPSTRRNIEILRKDGNTIIEPATGELASGLYGKGRMEEPEVILEKIIRFFKENSGDSQKKKMNNPLPGKKILITVGPTHEKIDPVRYISNHSSGKMGFAIAAACAERGADVILISGPVGLNLDHPRVTRIDVTSAAEMHARCRKVFAGCDAAIMTAAVADYTPVEYHRQKMKRTKDSLKIELKPTKDIAGELGKLKKKGQVLAGFALESQDELKHARQKLSKKNFDFIVLNSTHDKGAGFGVDTNKITIIDTQNKIQKFELKSKAEVAEDIVDKLGEYFSVDSRQ